jgi:hypothetical protein
LLRWGLFDSAMAKVGFYFKSFVYANGTIDMGHWKDKWADGGDGRYNCTYPDGLTDHGRMLQLFADTVRYTRNETWMGEHISAAVVSTVLVVTVGLLRPPPSFSPLLLHSDAQGGVSTSYLSVAATCS